ncbi:hypothetical protein VW35_13575 [Devosia soli]|uniref:Core-binding (CB) domain-containing protein n=1 Tax=Devosia soli TaxID=361041 RepID=A0A0F5L6W0_9HYPH|nr:hypothetical protein [Devosia soli]KKB78121.1 hypothetical protein VW35_13575 [Devosia soli]
MLLDRWREAVALGEIKAKSHAIDLLQAWSEEQNVDPARITQDDYDAFLLSLRQKDYAQNTIHSVDAHIRILLRWSVRVKLLSEMPVANRAYSKMERKASGLARDDIEFVIDELIALANDETRTPKTRLLDARRAAVAALHFYWGLQPSQVVALPWSLLHLVVADAAELGIDLNAETSPGANRFIESISVYRGLVGFRNPENRSQFAFFSRRDRQLALRAMDLSQDVRKGALEVGFALYEQFTSQELIRAYNDVFRASSDLTTKPLGKAMRHDRVPDTVAAELIIELATLHPRNRAIRK